MHDPWTLAYDRWDPAQEPAREALCALGNGRFATRAAAEEALPGGVHYPGTYLAGGYNRLVSEVEGHRLEHEALVNWPNWLPLTFRAGDGDWVRPERGEVLELWQELRMREGALYRRVRVRDAGGRETSLSSRRIVHMGDSRLCAIEWTLTPHDWSGPLVIRSAIHARIVNAGVARYRGLRGDHVDLIDAGAEARLLYVLGRSKGALLRLALAARTRVWVNGVELGDTRDASGDGIVALDWPVVCPPGGRVRVEKVCALVSSRDRAVTRPLRDARRAARGAASFETLHASQRRAWDRLWQRCDVEIGGDPHSQRSLRTFAFHLLQTMSPNSCGLDAGAPARGLHGEVYHGHVFWDDVFLFPFYELRLPQVARSLLMYRYRRLGRAREMAREAGLRGAMFPWRSGAEGWDETPTVQRNPLDQRWLPDHTHHQRHVNAAIAFNVWRYVHATQDDEFLSLYGAELILDIANCFASMMRPRRGTDRYEIVGVVGPDEFHTGYHDAPAPGLRNNAYTNVMAAWTLRCATRVLDRLPAYRRRELCADLDLEPGAPARWRDLAARMFVPFMDGGLIEQFEGYRELAELDWEAYRDRYGDIRRIDWILHAEDDTPNRYKVSKQADALMLLYLMPLDELQAVLASMGYELPVSAAQRMVDYYLARTTHGSSLSRIVDVWLQARADRHGSWPQVRALINEDVDSAHKDTTREGVHLGAMAGAIDLIQRCYGGVCLGEEALWLDPHLPAGLDHLRMPLRFRGNWLEVTALPGELVVKVLDGGRDVRAPIGVDGQIHHIHTGETRRFRREK